MTWVIVDSFQKILSNLFVESNEITEVLNKHVPICKQPLTFSIVNRGEGLEAGGVAKLCYCSLSRDNTGASKSI